MANVGRQKRISEFPIANTMGDTDRLLIITGTGSEPVTQTVSKGNFFKSVTALSPATLQIPKSTPANSTSNAVGQSIWMDTNFLYVAVANNVIKRVALSSF